MMVEGEGWGRGEKRGGEGEAEARDDARGKGTEGGRGQVVKVGREGKEGAVSRSLTVSIRRMARNALTGLQITTKGG